MILCLHFNSVLFCVFRNSDRKTFRGNYFLSPFPKFLIVNMFHKEYLKIEFYVGAVVYMYKQVPIGYYRDEIFFQRVT